MGIFSSATLALSTFFAGAPKVEVDAVNRALHGVALAQGTHDLTIIDDVEPATGWRPNRKQRRAHSQSFRQRTRNSEFSKRSGHKTPKAIHETANDKQYQYATHPLLWALLARGGYNRAVEGGAA